MMKYSVGIGVTSKCNMNCFFCYSRSKRLDREAGFSKWVNFFKENANKIKAINYGTAENSLSKHWFKLVRYIGEKYPRIKQAVTTNGSLGIIIKSNKNFKYIVNSFISEIDISIDYADEIKHDSFRRYTGAFRSAILTLDYCKENNKQATIVVLGTDDTLKIKNMQKIFEIAKRYGCFVRVNIYMPVNKRCRLNSPSFENIIKLFDWVYKNHTIISINDPLFSAICTKNETKKDTSAISSIRIIPNGDIFPSTYLIDNKYRAYNIRDKNCIEKSEKSDIFLKIKKRGYPENCNDCKIKSRCRGGSVDRRLLIFNNLDERDPYCPKRYGKGEKIRKYIIKKKNFNMVHLDYLSTFFFKPKEPRRFAKRI